MGVPTGREARFTLENRVKISESGEKGRTQDSGPVKVLVSDHPRNSSKL